MEDRKRLKLSISLTAGTAACIKRYAEKHRVTVSRAVSDIVQAACIDEDGEITAFAGGSGGQAGEAHEEPAAPVQEEAPDLSVSKMMDLMNEQLKFFMEQLQAKDTQLAARDRQISSLHMQLEREQYMRLNAQQGDEEKTALSGPSAQA